MNPGPNDLARQRVAFAIMCYRFGINPQRPPSPQAGVPVDLGTDLARSLERQKLTSSALIFLHDRPFLPFTWQPTPNLDFFRNLTFQRYHALCLMQLMPAMSPRAEVRETLRRTAMATESVGAAAAVQTEEVDDIDAVFSPLLEASGSQDREFSSDITDFPVTLER
jgi:hypothetical protein